MSGPFQKLRRQDGVSRRDVVVGATLVGGALLVGCSPAELMSAGSKVEPGAFGPFIQFDPDGAVTVLAKHIEKLLAHQADHVTRTGSHRKDNS